MNLDKAKRLLAKINVLVDNLEEQPSILEKDLLLKYVQDLYECFKSEEAPPVLEKTIPVRELKEEEPAVSLPPEPVKQIEESTEEAEVSGIPKEALISNTPLEPVTPEVISESEIRKDPPKMEDQSRFKEEIPESNEEEIVEEDVSTTTVEVIEEVNEEIDAKALHDLFVIGGSQELIDKLNAKPLDRIENGMGINERILTLNDLFNRQKDLFDDTLKALNHMDSFEQAKIFLRNGVAKNLNWLHPDKVDKARAFIKLVYRKYLNS